MIGVIRVYERTRQFEGQTRELAYEPDFVDFGGYYVIDGAPGVGINFSAPALFKSENNTRPKLGPDITQYTTGLKGRADALA